MKCKSSSLAFVSGVGHQKSLSLRFDKYLSCIDLLQAILCWVTLYHQLAFFYEPANQNDGRRAKVLPYFWGSFYLPLIYKNIV